MFRRATPEAAEHCIKIMREAEDDRVRLKAAEIILHHGMPKGDAALRAIMEGEVSAITIHVEHHVQTQPGPALPAEPSGPVITIDTVPLGSGDD